MPPGRYDVVLLGNNDGVSNHEILRLAGHGLTLTAEAAGPADGLPVLLLHGGGQRRSSWGAALAALGARGLRGVALDMRGHGDSDWSQSGAYLPEDFGADVAAIVPQVSALAGGRPVLLVGASMGGLASLCAAPQLGDQVAGLVMVDIVPHMRQEGTDRIVGFMLAAPDGFADVDEAADAVAAYLPHRPRPSATSGLLRNLRQRPDGRWIWHWDPSMVRNSMLDVEPYWARLDALAAQITVPTLLIRGLLSDIVDDAGVAQFRAVLPHLQVADVASAAHTAATDDNDVFVSTLLDFVGALTH
ncbi:MAG: alpha/beta fold hydrolase [Sporichthyaceae bacterium]